MNQQQSMAKGSPDGISSKCLVKCCEVAQSGLKLHQGKLEQQHLLLMDEP